MATETFTEYLDAACRGGLSAYYEVQSLYRTALARVAGLEAQLAAAHPDGGGLRELLDKRHDEWRDACDERDRALARAEAAITESNSNARRAFNAEVENQRLTKEAAGLRARAEAAEAERDDANIAASLNKSRVEEMVDRLSFEMKRREALAARVAELEAASEPAIDRWASAARSETQLRLEAAEARVAELEAELASDAADENQWLDAYIESAAKDGATIKRLMARAAELEAQLAAQGWRAMNTPPEAPGEYEIGADYIPDVRRAEYHADTNTWYEQIWQLADWATRWRPLPAPAPDTEKATKP